MFKVIDLLTGETVLDRVAEDYIGGPLSKEVAIRYRNGFPLHFWLSADAAEDYSRDETLMGDVSRYVLQNSRFIDADGDAEAELNESGCYLAFERAVEEPEYCLSGRVIGAGEQQAPLRIAAYDRDTASDDFCGLAYTSPAGRYRIPFSKDDFSLKAPFDFEGAPELYLEIARLDLVTGAFAEEKRMDVPESSERHVMFHLHL